MRLGALVTGRSYQHLPTKHAVKRSLRRTEIGHQPRIKPRFAVPFPLGQPKKRVVVLQGDGSLLMNLGSLVTIAAVAPKNLVHFVAHNETYEANGGHPIPQRNVDFASMARSAGYTACYDFADLDVFTQQVAHVLEQDGPVFATLHVEPSKPLFYDYPSLYDPAKRQAFKAAWQA